MKLNTNISKVSASKVYIKVIDTNGNEREISYDPFLYGLIKGCAQKRLKKYHSLILITGNVGDGKSTLGDGICGLDAYFLGKDYNLGDVVFSTTSFEENCDKLDNFFQPIKYDEAIEGATGQDMARSSKGLSFKKKIVQKRKKKHLYVMCIDELEEYSWKLIKMADAWIHVKAPNLRRGYFDITISKHKIKTKYLALKAKQYKYASSIRPDRPNCTFMDYTNVFIDDDKYQEKKDIETSKSSEKDNGKIVWSPEKIQAFGCWSKGFKQKDIVEATGVPLGTIKSWCANEFKLVVGQ